MCNVYLRRKHDGYVSESLSIFTGLKKLVIFVWDWLELISLIGNSRSHKWSRKGDMFSFFDCWTYSVANVPKTIKLFSSVDVILYSVKYAYNPTHTWSSFIPNTRQRKKHTLSCVTKPLPQLLWFTDSHLVNRFRNLSLKRLITSTGIIMRILAGHSLTARIII